MGIRIKLFILCIFLALPLAAQENYWPKVYANDSDRCTVHFSGEGSESFVRVASAYGWWYIDGHIPWCEVKHVSDSGFVLRCSVNSVNIARHSYLKVRTSGQDYALVAVVQATNPDNFLSSGTWRRVVGLNKYVCGDYALIIGDDNSRIANCPGCVYYVGGLNEGKKNGKGYCYDRYGNLIYSGKFINDTPVGEYPTRGDYSAYMFVCQKFSNGTYYIGETGNSLRNGFGILVSPDGQSWCGRWKAGVQTAGGVEITSTSSDSGL